MAMHVDDGVVMEVDVAGVSLIGLGAGRDMPRIDFTLAAAEVIIGAASVTIENINFHANVPEVLLGVTIEAAGDYAKIRNCRFDAETLATDEFVNCVHIATTADHCRIEGCNMDMGEGDGATAAIFMEDAGDGNEIVNNKIYGNYSTANVVGNTAACTNLVIGGNIMYNGMGGDVNAQPNVELFTGTTGLCYDNIFAGNTNGTTHMVGDQVMQFRNIYNETVGVTTTGAYLGTASADD
jgi:hypothetical protein